MKKMNLIASLCCLILMIVTVNMGTAAQKSVVKSGQATVNETLIAAKIDINRADGEMLTNLPGVGPKMAERIQEHRKVNGPFKSVDDLLNIKGIGPKVLEKIKPFATVS